MSQNFHKEQFWRFTFWTFYLVTFLKLYAPENLKHLFELGCEKPECRTSTSPDKSPLDNSPPDNNNPGQVPLLFGVGQVHPRISPPRPTTSVSLGITASHAQPSLYVLVSSLQHESTASINGYVAVITLVIPASTEVKHASFSSPDTQQ